MGTRSFFIRSSTVVFFAAVTLLLLQWSASVDDRPPSIPAIRFEKVAETSVGDARCVRSELRIDGGTELTRIVASPAWNVIGAVSFSGWRSEAMVNFSPLGEHFDEVFAMDVTDDPLVYGIAGIVQTRDRDAPSWKTVISGKSRIQDGFWGIGDFVFSPDGKRYSFRTFIGPGRLYLVDEKGSVMGPFADAQDRTYDRSWRLAFKGIDSSGFSQAFVEGQRVLDFERLDSVRTGKDWEFAFVGKPAGMKEGVWADGWWVAIEKSASDLPPSQGVPRFMPYPDEASGTAVAYLGKKVESFRLATVFDNGDAFGFFGWNPGLVVKYGCRPR